MITFKILNKIQASLPEIIRNLELSFKAENAIFSESDNWNNECTVWIGKENQLHKCSFDLHDGELCAIEREHDARMIFPKE